MARWWGKLPIDYRPGRLGKNTLLGTAGLGVRAVIQAGYLLIVSRWLGAEGYGLFAGSVALFILAAPLANWGGSLLLMQYIARERGNVQRMWATTLVQTGVVGVLLICIALVVSAVLLQQRVPLGAMLLLALSELLLLPAVQLATSLCYALERGVASATVMCLVPLGRVLAMAGAIAIGFPATADYAAMAHFFGSVTGLLVAAVIVAAIAGWPAWRSRLSLFDVMRQGTPFAISNMAGVSYQEVDKVLMLQSLGAAAVGPYTVAFRIASIFLMPVMALVSAGLPRLISHAGNSTGRQTYRAMLLCGIAYGLLVGVGVVVAAPWIPRVFGSDYAPAVHWLILLAPWPALFAFRHCMAAQLTASGLQTARTCIEVAGLGGVVALNSVLLPRVGVGAAVLTLLVAETLVAASMWLLISRRRTL